MSKIVSKMVSNIASIFAKNFASNFASNEGNIVSNIASSIASNNTSNIASANCNFKLGYTRTDRCKDSWTRQDRWQVAAEKVEMAKLAIN